MDLLRTGLIGRRGPCAFPFGKSGKTLSELKTLPAYQMIKEKIQLDPAMDVDELLKNVADHFSGEIEHSGRSEGGL